MKSIVFAVFSVCFLSCSTLFAGEAITPKQSMELFDGKGFTGWRFLMEKGADPAKTWTVANGMIHCSGKPTGFVRTEKTYSNYTLTVEWRYVKVAPKADNSGILVHLQEPDKIWPPCVQVQGKSGRQGDVFLMAGAESAEHKGKDANTALPFHGESHEKPIGEWNIVRVVCSGDTMKVFVNGEPANEITACTLTSGGIGIQSEGAEMEIRRIAIGPIE